MRIAIYSHDANPAVDHPSYKLSFSRAVEAVKSGDIFMLTERTAQKYPPPLPEDEQPFKGQVTPACLTEGEMLANAGAASYPAIRAARAKVIIWPYIGDDLAVRVGIRV